MAGAESSILRQPKTARAQRLTWRNVYFWYGAAFFSCVIGAYLHDSVFTSDIFEQWAILRSSDATFHLTRTWSDILRASGALIASLFALRQMDALSGNHRRAFNYKSIGKLELALIAVAVTAALFVAFDVLPTHFYIGLVTLISQHTLITSEPFTYTDIWHSYVPYSFYVIGLWLGMAFPVFFFLVRSIDEDRRHWKRLGDDASSAARETTTEALSALMNTWHDRRLILLEVATHYVSVLIPLAILILLEAFFFKGSATAFADRAGYIALSLMLLPALAISTGVFSVLYVRELKNTEDGLRSFIARCGRKNETVKAAAHKHLEELEKCSVLDFISSVLKTRNCVLIIIVSFGQFFVFSLWLPTKIPVFTKTLQMINHSQQR